MTLGWLIDAATRDSRTNRSLNASSSLSSGVNTLIATLLPSRTLSARYTTLMPPRPRTPSSPYPANAVPMRGKPAVDGPDPNVDESNPSVKVSLQRARALSHRGLAARPLLGRHLVAVLGDVLFHLVS